MSYEVNLNGLVEAGKQDIVAYIGGSISGSQNGVFMNQLSLAMKKGGHGINLHKTRELILRENEQILAHAHENDVTLLTAMARAAGRIVQLEDYYIAAHRLAMAAEADPQAPQAWQAFMAMIEQLQAVSVRLSSKPTGFQLNDIYPAAEKSCAIC